MRLALPFRLLLVGLTCFPVSAAIVSAQSALYWAQNSPYDAVRTSDTAGNNVSELTPTLTNPWGIAYDGTHLYFTEDSAGNLWRMDPDGGNRTLLASGLNYPRDIAVANNQLYWGNISGGVFRSDLDGTNITTLTTVSGGFLQGIFADSSYLYWTDSINKKIQRSNLDGSGVTDLVTTGLNIPYGIWATSSQLYWVDLSNGVLQRSNLDGTGVSTLISGLSGPSGLLVTDAKIFFTSQYSGVYSADLDGTNLTQLVTGGSDYRFIDGAISAVPEPSTYAMLIGAMALGVVMWRRRTCPADNA